MNIRWLRKRFQMRNVVGVLLAFIHALFWSQRHTKRRIPIVLSVLALIFFVGCRMVVRHTGPRMSTVFIETNASQYHVTDLGDITAVKINNHGWVVGHHFVAGPAYEAVLWRDGKLYGLGTLGIEHSYATGVSGKGQIVGTLEIQDFAGFYLRQQAVLFEQGRVRKLAPLPGHLVNAAQGVNDHDKVVGYTYPSGNNKTRDRDDNLCRALLWSGDGTVTDLSELCDGKPSRANAINDAGVVVGKYGEHLGLFSGRACLWKERTFVDLGMLPGDTYSVAVAINRRDEVVGDSKTGGVIRAFLWKDGVMTELGALDRDAKSHALDINDDGLVIGASGGRACLWRNEKPYDLNRLIPPDSGWRLESASAINDAGLIVGQGTVHGQRRAFLLTPS